MVDHQILTKGSNSGFLARYSLAMVGLAPFVCIILLVWEIRTPALWPVGASGLAMWFFHKWLVIRNRFKRLETVSKLKDVLVRVQRRLEQTRHSPLQERIGDVERDKIIRELGEHYAAGRLMLGEYEERVDQALKCKTQNDLLTPLIDLPSWKISV